MLIAHRIQAQYQINQSEYCKFRFQLNYK